MAEDFSGASIAVEDAPDFSSQSVAIEEPRSEYDYLPPLAPITEAQLAEDQTPKFQRPALTLLADEEAFGGIPRIPTFGAEGSRTRAATEFASNVQESMLRGAEGMTTRESMLALPAFAVPVVGPGLALGLGAKAVGAGMGELVTGAELHDPRMAGSGFGQVLLGAPMLGAAHPIVEFPRSIQALRETSPIAPPPIEPLRPFLPARVQPGERAGIPIPTAGEVMSRPGPPTQPKPAPPLVPETAAEARETVIESIRKADARTLSQIQSLFPEARLSREQARVFRNLAFPPVPEPVRPQATVADILGKQPPPEEPPAGGVAVPKPPPEPVGGPSASEISPSATVYGDVRPQPVEGEGQVPIKEGGAGVQPRSEAQAQVLLTDPAGNAPEFYSLPRLRALDARNDPRIAAAKKYYGAKTVPDLVRLAKARFEEMAKARTIIREPERYKPPTEAPAPPEPAPATAPEPPLSPEEQAAAPEVPAARAEAAPAAQPAEPAPASVYAVRTVQLEGGPKIEVRGEGAVMEWRDPRRTGAGGRWQLASPTLRPKIEAASRPAPAEAPAPREPYPVRPRNETEAGFMLRLQGRQPYEMTLIDWQRFQSYEYLASGERRARQDAANLSTAKQRDTFHRQSVETALREGKPVPPEVLADYPDLRAPAPTAPAAPLPPRNLPGAGINSKDVARQYGLPEDFYGTADEQGGVSSKYRTPEYDAALEAEARVAGLQGVNATTIRRQARQRIEAAFKEVVDKARSATPAAPAPAAAQAKAQAEVSRVASTEGKRSAKDIKDELVARLEQAVKDAPETFDAASATKVTIEIPGDGTFTVWNSKEALSSLLDRAKKLKTDTGIATGKVSTRPLLGREFIKSEANRMSEHFKGDWKAWKALEDQKKASELDEKQLRQIQSVQSELGDRGNSEIGALQRKSGALESEILRLEDRFATRQGEHGQNVANWPRAIRDANINDTARLKELREAFNENEAQLSKLIDAKRIALTSESQEPPPTTPQPETPAVPPPGPPKAAAGAPEPPEPPQPTRYGMMAPGAEMLLGDLPILSISDAGIQSPGTAPFTGKARLFSEVVIDAAKWVRDIWRGFAMKQAPRITDSNRAAGEAGVQYASSHLVARSLGLEFAGDVRGQTKIDKSKLGTALTEDNLRSVRAGWQAEANKLASAGDTAGAADAQAKADAVRTLIRAERSPFKTEEEYKAFLNDPVTQEVIARHKQLWTERKDPIYRKANDLDPDVPLSTRGLETGARINLKAIAPGDTAVKPVGGQPAKLRQFATKLRRDPFARRAKGTGEAYETDYDELMAHGFGVEYPIASQHNFVKALLDAGDAVVTAKEVNPDLRIKGEKTVANLLNIKPWRTQWLQVRRSLADEYRAISNLDEKWQIPILTPLNNIMTRASIQGLAEGSTHTSNLLMEIFTGLGPTNNPLINAVIKSLGRPDLVYRIPKVLIKAFTGTNSEMLRLAEQGMAKQPYQGRVIGNMLNAVDKGVRLVSAELHDGMAKEGWVEDTVTDKREFINQVGNYNKRLQPWLIRKLRDTGVQPFATAMQTFNVMGLRRTVMAPGAKATSNMAALALRADIAAGFIGFAVLATMLNKLVSGSATGPKGTPLGAIGWTDERGRVHTFNLARLLGYERGPRFLGITPYIEARRNGLTHEQGLEAMQRQWKMNALSYPAGPGSRFLYTAGTGMRMTDPETRQAPAVPPTESLNPFKSQMAKNIQTAVIEASPLLSSLHERQQGKSLGDIAEKQLSRYTSRTARTEQFVEALPRIVTRKDVIEYADDVAKEARKLPLGDRMDYIYKRFDKDSLEGQYRKGVMDEIKRKGVFRYE